MFDRGPRQPDRYTYFVEVTTRPTARAPFGGTPSPIPGTVQAEDFDEGGQDLTYSDRTPTNVPGAYRPNVAVDIEARDDGGFQVTGVESGEWLEYTVDVAQAGVYDVAVYVATAEGGGRLRVTVGDQQGPTQRTETTGGDQALAPIVSTLTLAAGEQVLRLDLLSATSRPYNVDRIEVQRAGATASEAGVAASPFRVFPNPATDAVSVRLGPVGEGVVSVYSVLGREVRRVALAHGQDTTITVADLAAGTYLVRAVVDGRVVGQEVFVKR